MKLKQLTTILSTSIVIAACSNSDGKTQEAEQNSSPVLETKQPDTNQGGQQESETSDGSTADSGNLDEATNNHAYRSDLTAYNPPISERISLNEADNLEAIIIESIHSLTHIGQRAIFASHMEEGTFGHNPDQEATFSESRECNFGGELSIDYNVPSKLTFNGNLAFGQGESAQIDYDYCAVMDPSSEGGLIVNGSVDILVSSGSYNGLPLVNNTQVTQGHKDYAAYVFDEIEYYRNGNIGYHFNDNSTLISLSDLSVYEYLDPGEVHYYVEEFETTLTYSEEAENKDIELSVETESLEISSFNSYVFNPIDFTVELRAIEIIVDVSLKSPIKIDDSHHGALSSGNLSIASEEGVINVSITNGEASWSIDYNNDEEIDLSGTLSPHQLEIFL